MAPSAAARLRRGRRRPDPRVVVGRRRRVRLQRDDGERGQNHVVPREVRGELRAPDAVVHEDSEPCRRAHFARELPPPLPQDARRAHDQRPAAAALPPPRRRGVRDHQSDRGEGFTQALVVREEAAPGAGPRSFAAAHPRHRALLVPQERRREEARGPVGVQAIVQVGRVVVQVPSPRTVGQVALVGEALEDARDGRGGVRRDARAESHAASVRRTGSGARGRGPKVAGARARRSPSPRARRGARRRGLRRLRGRVGGGASFDNDASSEASADISDEPATSPIAPWRARRRASRRARGARFRPRLRARPRRARSSDAGRRGEARGSDRACASPPRGAAREGARGRDRGRRDRPHRRAKRAAGSRRRPCGSNSSRPPCPRPNPRRSGPCNTRDRSSSRRRTRATASAPGARPARPDRGRGRRGREGGAGSRKGGGAGGIACRRSVIANRDRGGDVRSRDATSDAGRHDASPRVVPRVARKRDAREDGFRVARHRAARAGGVATRTVIAASPAAFFRPPSPSDPTSTRSAPNEPRRETARSMRAGSSAAVARVGPRILARPVATGSGRACRSVAPRAFLSEPERANSRGRRLFSARRKNLPRKRGVPVALATEAAFRSSP